MAFILIRNGRDPNVRYFGKESAWERALSCVSDFKPGDTETINVQRDYLKVIIVLIRRGANLQASIYRNCETISAMEILHTAYLREFPREFPTESEELFGEINRNLRRRGMSPDYYRPRSPDGRSAKRFRPSH
jgi:hypothetical protein